MGVSACLSCWRCDGDAVPAAVAAACCPGRQIITLVGDGGFLMTGSELATALQYGTVKIFVADKGSYGTIRLHQERQYPGRPSATELLNPNFAKLAKAYGARGLTIETIDEAPEVVEQALAEPGPVVVSVSSAVEHISAFATLSDLAP